MTCDLDRIFGPDPDPMFSGTSPDPLFDVMANRPFASPWVLYPLVVVATILVAGELAIEACRRRVDAARDLWARHFRVVDDE